MAQVNISHITPISADESRRFAELARDAAALTVHGLQKLEIQPDSVSVLTVAIDPVASLSGADSEVQLLVSGNDWPKDQDSKPFGAQQAKVHFDNLAAKFYEAIAKAQSRNIYVWVTPFTATGWAEGN